MIEIVLFVLVIGLVLSFVDLRSGMYVTLAVGFLQDPFRKIVADEPVFITALVVLFAAVTFLGAKMQGRMLSFDSIPDWSRQMQVSVAAFVLMIVMQSAASFAYTGSIALAGIGLVAYLSPFPAFLLSYSFASSVDRMIGFLWFYVALCAVMVCGIYLSWMGVDWGILNTVGEPLTVYLQSTGEAMDLPAGFFRAPEVAAWHAAAGFCISVILGLAGRRGGSAWVTGGLALFFMGAVFLTGRRKFLVELMVFLPFLLILLMHFKAGGGRLVRTMAALTIVGIAMLAAGLITSETTSSLAELSVRNEEQGVVELLERRFVDMTIGSLEYVLDANGFFGSGAGSGSQGSQHFGGGEELVGLSAEGGLGKILAEIGVPGMIIVIWVASSFFVYIWRTLGQLPRGGEPISFLAMGLAAFLFTNGIVFVGAHQVFGDLFVLLMIGNCFGFIVATRRFSEEERLPTATFDAPNLASRDFSQKGRPWNR